MDVTPSTETSEIYEPPTLVDLGTLEELTLGLPVFQRTDTCMMASSGLLNTCS